MIVLFYFFATLLVMSTLLVFFAKNQVTSVLFLVFAFLNSTFLFISIGAEFVGIILAIVYIGAVAILFLFVVMMLDITRQQMVSSIKNYIPLIALFGIVIIGEIIYLTIFESNKNFPKFNEINFQSNNTEEIGNIIYTDYIIEFQISGIILLLAMIGAIVLTHIYKPSIKRQNISSQNATSKTSRVQLVDKDKYEGIS